MPDVEGEGAKPASQAPGFCESMSQGACSPGGGSDRWLTLGLKLRGAQCWGNPVGSALKGRHGEGDASKTKPGPGTQHTGSFQWLWKEGMTEESVSLSVPAAPGGRES